MRIAIALVVASLALPAANAAAAESSSSGIRGSVIKSPTSPVCQEGVPCSGPAADVALVVFRAGVKVATVRTSDAGMYRFVLRPGTYVIRSVRRSMFGYIPPRTVRVRPGRFTVVNFEIDTGVR